MGTSSDSLNSRRGCCFFSFSSFCSVNVLPPPLPLLLPLSLSPLVLFSLPSPPTWEADESDSGTAEVGQLICAHRPFPHKRSTAYLPVHVFFGFHRQTTLDPMRVFRHGVFAIRITD